MSRELLILSGIVSKNFSDTINNMILTDILSKINITNLDTSVSCDKFLSKKSIINSFLNDTPRKEKEKPNEIIIKNTESTTFDTENIENSVFEIKSEPFTFDNNFFKQLFKNIKNEENSLDILEILLNVTINSINYYSSF